MLKTGSPPGSGSSYKTTTTTTSATAGQSANIDLIISRLQGELTRSQEANANLGILKQGLGDLEKSIVVSTKEDGSIPSPKNTEATSVQDTAAAAAAANYQKQLEEHTQVFFLCFVVAEELSYGKSFLTRQASHIISYYFNLNMIGAQGRAYKAEQVVGRDTGRTGRVHSKDTTARAIGGRGRDFETGYRPEHC